MRPIEKREMLKNKFKKINTERKNANKEIITVSKLGLEFVPSTFDWFRTINGGNKADEQ